MRTSMNIPRELLAEAVKVSGAPTQTVAVVMGLQELIRKKRMQRLLDMRGSDAVVLTRRDVQAMRRR
jgi:hypothetical protein